MSNPKELNSLTEQDARAVQVAVGELQERNIVIEGYEVNVVIRGETTIVIFVPSDWKAGMPGSSSDQLSYEVKLTSDLQTLSVTAVR